MTSWTKFPLSRTVHAVQVYKSLQIIGTLFNDAFGFLLSVSTLFALSQHTVYSFISIKFHNILPAPLILTFVSCIALFFLYETVTFPLFGAMNTKSVAFLARPERNESQVTRKTRRGLMELGVSIGGCYVMKRYSLLTFLMLVCNTTSNLLVST